MPPDVPVSESNSDELILASLKADLNRTGNFPGDDDYLSDLISGSREWLAAQGVRDDGSANYRLILVGQAAYIYRKRVTGESQPNYLRRMLNDWKLSHPPEV